MNEVVNMFLLVGDKFMQEMHLMVSLMNQNINWQMTFINQLLESFKKEKCIHFLETIFRMLIWLICNHWANITKDSSIYCEQLICLVHMHGLFLWKIKQGTSIANAFKKIISEGSEGWRKPNKIWVDEGSEFYNNTFKDFWK